MWALGAKVGLKHSGKNLDDGKLHAFSDIMWNVSKLLATEGGHQSS
jgi:hypothetical protein